MRGGVGLVDLAVLPLSSETFICHHVPTLKHWLDALGCVVIWLLLWLGGVFLAAVTIEAAAFWWDNL